MGYSQIFTYVFLGVISTPSASIADGIECVHAPLVNTNIFDNAIIEEIGETNRNDRDVLHLHGKGYDSVASLFLPISCVETGNNQAFEVNPFSFHSHAGDSYIRFRAFRL